MPAAVSREGSVNSKQGLPFLDRFMDSKSGFRRLILPKNETPKTNVNMTTDLVKTPGIQDKIGFVVSNIHFGGR